MTNRSTKKSSKGEAQAPAQPPKRSRKSNLPTVTNESDDRPESSTARQGGPRFLPRPANYEDSQNRPISNQEASGNRDKGKGRQTSEHSDLFVTPDNSRAGTREADEGESLAQVSSTGTVRQSEVPQEAESGGKGEEDDGEDDGVDIDDDDDGGTALDSEADDDVAETQEEEEAQVQQEEQATAAAAAAAVIKQKPATNFANFRLPNMIEVLSMRGLLNHDYGRKGGNKDPFLGPMEIAKIFLEGQEKGNGHLDKEKVSKEISRITHKAKTSHPAIFRDLGAIANQQSNEQENEQQVTEQTSTNVQLPRQPVPDRLLWETTGQERFWDCEVCSATGIPDSLCHCPAQGCDGRRDRANDQWATVKYRKYGSGKLVVKPFVGQ